MALTQKFLHNISIQSWKVAMVRYSSFLTSKPVQPLEKYPEIEIVKNPPEWKYVERVLPKLVIPKPLERTEYPSGWKPPKVGSHNIDQLSYYVARTKNYMLPVYLKTTHRGQRRLTIVRHVQGNLWQLESELRQLVEKERGGKVCVTRVNEMSRQVHIHGDYVDIIREYLKSKGY
uniref:Large ribosomal subunit protein mL49 n=1 Tax=Glossina brevipalpis TaxID=37001 RepID=A0A1A9WX34_9MUSC